MKEPMSKTAHFSVMAVLLVLTAGASMHAAELSDSYALLIQQSPPDAGTVSPGSGVHKVQIGDTVSLSAIPRPGYRFLYWLGDVSAVEQTDTTIQVDSPKLVVAVFTREAYEEELPGVRLIRGSSYGGSSGGGRLIGTQAFSPSGISPGSYYDPADFIYIDNSTIIDNNNDDDNDLEPRTDDIPVPGEDGTEVPEPATLLLFGLGAVVLLRSKHKI